MSFAAEAIHLQNSRDPLRHTSIDLLGERIERIFSTKPDYEVWWDRLRGYIGASEWLS